MHQWACSIIIKEFKLGSVISILSILIKFYLCLNVYLVGEIHANFLQNMWWNLPEVHLICLILCKLTRTLIFKINISLCWRKQQIRGFHLIWENILVYTIPTCRNLGPNFSKLCFNTFWPLKIYILALKINHGAQNLVKI